MSKIEVNEIDAQSGSTITVGSACKSVAVPGNVVKTNAVQASDGGNIVSQSGTTITLGASGDTVSLASGASQSGFGRTGTVDWQTGSIKTSDFTAVDGQGFFVDTNGGAVTVTLPTGSAGSIISLQDYRNTFDTNNCTVTAGGSQKINGGTAAGSVTLTTEGEGITLVYIDSTVGWRSIQDNTFADVGAVNIIASGGTESTTPCGNYKIHKFTGPGTFTVSQVSSIAANNNVSYLVVAGGGGGTSSQGGAGGAGGFRELRGPVSGCYSVSPLNGAPSITLTAQAYPITVGGGGAGNKSDPCQGSNSVFSTVTSAGGGAGGQRTGAGGNGGSGGGTGACKASPFAGGSGNTPSTSPAQGQDGGARPSAGDAGGGAGGGAGGAGATGAERPVAGAAGGAGVTTSITAAAVAYAGGGGGGQGGPPGTGNAGGAGGTGGGGGGGGGGGAGSGGTPGSGTAGQCGEANTGGGGGAGSNPSNNPVGGASGSGGSGIVVLRYRVTG